MIVRPPAQWPPELAVGVRNRVLIDAGVSGTHEAVLGELPVLIAVGSEPVSAVIVVLVSVADRDAVLGKGPELLDKAVIELFRPFPSQKRLDSVTPSHELGT